MKSRINLMLDSGAFSAWSHEETIDIKQYVSFILKYRECFSTVVNLDVIPGTWEKKPTVEELKITAQKSYKNALELRSAGIDPIVVFHQGEEFSCLERYLDTGFKHIGFGCRNNAHQSVKKMWLDSVFSFLKKRSDFFQITTHGFATTSAELMSRYPWSSVDSVTWILASVYGYVMIPRGVDSAQAPFQVDFGSRKLRSGNHFNKLGPTGTWLDVGIILLDEKKLMPLLEELLDYGQLRGLGQWRNSGMGRFEWKRLDGAVR